MLTEETIPRERMDYNKDILNQINEIRKKGNFQTVKKTIGEEKLKGFINSIYPQFSITEIENMTDIPDSTLEHWFKRLNISAVRNHIDNISLPGDIDSQVIMRRGEIAQKVSTIKVTPELAYLIGFTLGDGSVQKFMVEVFNKDRRLRQVLFDYLKPYGSITEEERSNGLWRLRLSSVRIANLIKDKNGIRKDTMDYIFNNDLLARQFIAAFWDAEGSVLRQIKSNVLYYHIYLYNSNRYLIDKVCSFLKSKNIKLSLHERMTRDKPYTFQGRIIKSTKGLTRVNIHKASWAVWVDAIGLMMRHSKKRKIVDEIMSITRIEKNGN